MVTCPSCATPNPPTMNFCKMCGESLKAAAQSQPQTNPPAAPIVTPAKISPEAKRQSLPSALAAVVGGPVKPRAATPNATMKKPMIAAAPPAALLETAQTSPPPPAAVSTRVCGSCGAATPSNFPFCQKCGHKLDDDTDSQPIITVTDGVADTLSAAASDVVPLVKKRAPTAAGAAYGRLVAVMRDGSDGNVYPLAEDAVDVGRTDGALTFDDRFLAPRHARIERRGAGGVALVPLDSTNGVYVRLRSAESYVLVDGDFLLLGKEVMRFEVVEPEERNLAPAMQYGVRLFGSPVRSPWGRLRQIVQTGASRDIYHLVASQVVIGREEGDLRFADDEFMSRRHARITNRDGRYEITDLESSNGSFVRVRGERALRMGDVVRMGDQLFRFETV